MFKNPQNEKHFFNVMPQTESQLGLIWINPISKTYIWAFIYLIIYIDKNQNVCQSSEDTLLIC